MEGRQVYAIQKYLVMANYHASACLANSRNGKTLPTVEIWEDSVFALAWERVRKLAIPPIGKVRGSRVEAGTEDAPIVGLDVPVRRLEGEDIHIYYDGSYKAESDRSPEMTGYGITVSIPMQAHFIDACGPVSL